MRCGRPLFVLQYVKLALKHFNLGTVFGLVVGVGITLNVECATRECQPIKAYVFWKMVD